MMSEDFFRKICTSHFIVRVTQGFTVRGSWRQNRTAIYWPPLLWPSALYLSRSPGLLTQRHSGSTFCWVLAFSTTSCLWLIPSPTPSGVPRASSAGGSFPYHISSLTRLISNCLTSCLDRSYNSSTPTQSPLILWNGMFDRHQAEITIMQFTGHSLPVHQSMSVSWAFALSHFVSQFRLRYFFLLLTIGMCHFLPVHHLGIACLAGPKVYI